MSPANQRIEGWWSFLKRSNSSWWISFFKDMSESGLLSLGDTFHLECLWFCFAKVIQADLDKVTNHWNKYHIRHSRHDTIEAVMVQNSTNQIAVNIDIYYLGQR